MSRVIRNWLFVALTIGMCQASLFAQAGSASTQDAPVPIVAPEALTISTVDGRVVLSWRAVDGATGYHVFRAMNTAWEPQPLASVPVTTYSGTNVAASGAPYAYAVAAYNSAGTGPYSIVLATTPLAQAVEPRAATVLTTPAGGAPAPEMAAAPMATSPAMASAAAGPAPQPAPPAAAPLFVSSAPIPSAARAASSAGATSASGSTATQTAAAAPRAVTTAPATPPATPAAARAARQASASTAPAATPTASATAAQPAPAVSTPATPAPAAVTPAPIEVSPSAPQPAVAAATTAPAAAASAAPVPPSTAPGGIAAVAGDGRVVLTWQPVSGVTGYFVFRAAGGVWGSTPVAVLGGTSYTNTGLTNGTTYSYRVAGYNTDGGAGPQSASVNAVPMTSPKGLKGTAGNTTVELNWQVSAGATSYLVYRSTSDVDSTFVALANIVATSFLDTGLTNDTRYYYRVRALAENSQSDLSTKISAIPVTDPPAAAPANLVAAPGNTRIVLTWDGVGGATSYRVFRTTTGVFERQWIASVTTPTFTNTGLTNGTAYSYRVVARNAGGDGPVSAVVTAAPTAPPAAPAAIKATGGNGQIVLRWAPSSGALTYNVYRGAAPGAQATTPVAGGVAGTEFIDAVSNGPSYYYKVTALNGGGESSRSPEVTAAGTAPPAVIDTATQDAYRVLQQATWGPTLAEVERVKQIGAAAFIDEQLAMPPSVYPDTLLTQPLEMSQEHFMQLALTGPDQLRQRVAWALHKIWVASAVEVPSTRAILTYYRLLMAGAFGNYRDLMRAITLNPAMGRYLNMLNNQSQQATGFPPNENYARELMQLFTLGLTTLNPDGTPQVGGNGAPVPAYTEQDVVELARILTGWTFGDGNPATIPRQLARENYGVPMEAVPTLHDYGPKTFLGHAFPGGQTPEQDLEQALDILFQHQNVGPFISRQLIQQLVMSNPSPAYVSAVTAVFNGGAGRGDLAAVVRAVLTHPEAGSAQATAGKLSEPVLFVLSPLRAFGATVADYPFMSTMAETLGQKVFFPPSVFSYFSPGYRVRGTAVGNGQPLGGPEFQILTSVTALERANYVGYLINGNFGTNVVIDYTQFNARAADPGALVDYCNLVFMGGRMSAPEWDVVVAAVRAASTNASVTERVRTAIYLSLVIAQSQVDR